MDLLALVLDAKNIASELWLSIRAVYFYFQLFKEENRG